MTLSASKPIAIQLKNCAKTFPDGTRVLDALNLEIVPGETLVLLGPSGCGKTTTLRLIAGLEQPDQGGQVLFDGQDVTPLGIEKRNVGMVFQSYALFPNMTVAENVGYGLRVQKMPVGEQRQRVALALGDRVVVMSQGKIAQIGSPRDIYHQPRNAFVADFIGTMNRVTGTVTPAGLICEAGCLRVDPASHTTGEILFRPEDVQDVEGDLEPDLTGTVAASFFLGDRTRLLVDIGQQRPLVVERFARCSLQVGQRVGMTVNPSGLLAV